MHGSSGPEDRFPPATAESAITEGKQNSTTDVIPGRFREPSRDQANASRGLAETELDSALQLLVERAQYITGATGTALALPQGEEMVCRASAGLSAPAVGARLQVRSGLTGESISRRQLLRCDNAETDPRVNLEACRALGIASIVVMPLLRHNGEVGGLFELFSDHPYAFEERDLTALERMAGLTLTALDLAEQRESSATTPALRRETGKPVESSAASGASVIPIDLPHVLAHDLPREAGPAKPEAAETENGKAEPAESVAPAVEPPVNPQPPTASVPEAMLRVQKCESCGFPVSEGRTLCLDCEKKDRERKDSEKKDLEKKQHGAEEDAPAVVAVEAAAPMAEEPVPAFLANYAPAHESWMANHVNLLALIVLILGILVAIVVFR